MKQTTSLKTGTGEVLPRIESKLVELSKVRTIDDYSSFPLDSDEEEKSFKSGLNMNLICIERIYGGEIGWIADSIEVEVFGLKREDGHYPFYAFCFGSVYRAVSLVDVGKLIIALQNDLLAFRVKYPILERAA